MLTHTKSLSPSAFKPKLVVEDWQNDALVDAEICSFEPATYNQLCLAHLPLPTPLQIGFHLPNLG